MEWLDERKLKKLIRFLALLFGWWIYKPYSSIIRAILVSKGIHVGKNFYIQGVPFLKIRGPSSNIKIGNNVSIHGNIDFRNRERMDQSLLKTMFPLIQNVD